MRREPASVARAASLSAGARDVEIVCDERVQPITSSSAPLAAARATARALSAFRTRRRAARPRPPRRRPRRRTSSATPGRRGLRGAAGGRSRGRAWTHRIARETRSDLALGGLVESTCTRSGRLDREVAADRAGGGLERVGGADEWPRPRRRRRPRARRDQRRARDEVDQLAEERRSVARRSGSRRARRGLDELQGGDLQALALEAARISPVRPRRNVSGLTRMRFRDTNDAPSEGGWRRRGAAGPELTSPTRSPWPARGRRAPGSAAPRLRRHAGSRLEYGQIFHECTSGLLQVPQGSLSCAGSAGSAGLSLTSWSQPARRNLRRAAAPRRPASPARARGRRPGTPAADDHVDDRAHEREQRGDRRAHDASVLDARPASAKV